MEFLNKIELQGVVGVVNIVPIGAGAIMNLSVVTENAFTDRTGTKVIEVTWFNVSATSASGRANFDQIQKGSWVHIVGRLRWQKHIDSSGVEKTYYSVFAQDVELLKEK